MEHKATHTLKNYISILGLSGMVALSACSGFDIEPLEEGMMTIRLTDSPSDNPEVDSVFATIASVKVDGKIISEFKGPKTINITALQNGQTELLATGELMAQQYHTITLTIDFERDDQGEPMGVYYLKRNGSKVKLNSGSQKSAGYSFIGSTRVFSDDTSSVVLDFDLRKFLKVLEDGNVVVSGNSELAGYLRFADLSRSGDIKGSYTGTQQQDKVVVYAYKRGSFIAQAESKGKAGIKFLNAVSSAVVSPEGFLLPFMEEGEYELHFASFSPIENDMMFEGFIKAENALNGEPLNTLKPVAGTEITVDVIADGLLN